MTAAGNVSARGARRPAALALAALALVSLTTLVQGISFSRLEDPVVKAFRRKPSSYNRMFAEGVHNVTTGEPFDSLKVSPRPQGFPGAAIFDIDGDGDLDILVPTGPGQEHALFINTLVPEGTFGLTLTCGNQSCASAFGLAFFERDGNGLCTGDIDNDGDQDLVILNFNSPWQLLRNDGGVFAELSLEPQNVTEGYAPTSCTFGDVDNDGLVDLVVAFAADFPLSLAFTSAMRGLSPHALNKPNRLLMNKGPEAASHFVDETYSRGFEKSTPNNLTWSSALVDYDGDGDVDFFTFDDVGNALPMNVNRGLVHLWKNDGSGFFEFVPKEESGLVVSSTNMGSIFADFNCDGSLDFYVTHVGSLYSTEALTGPNPSEEKLFAVFQAEDMQLGFGSANGTFQPSVVMDSSGNNVHPPFGWGVLAEDFDNDGDADVAYVGGLNMVSRIILSTGVMLRNTGCTGFFERVKAFEGQDFERYIMSGASAADLNNDGFMDFVAVAGNVVPENATLASYKDFVPEIAVDTLSGSPFSDDLYFYPTLLGPDGQMQWNGPNDEEGNPVLLEDGILAVEVNNANNNNWVKVKLRGSIGDVDGAKVNRDGTGAIISFTPNGGATSAVPQTSGILHGSSDKTKIFGLGSQTEGQLAVKWPGGTVNVLKVTSGETVIMPEIPCNVNVNGDEGQFTECLGDSLATLMQKGIINDEMHNRLFSSMIEAYNAPKL